MLTLKCYSHDRSSLTLIDCELMWGLGGGGGVMWEFLADLPESHVQLVTRSQSLNLAEAVPQIFLQIMNSADGHKYPSAGIRAASLLLFICYPCTLVVMCLKNMLQLFNHTDTNPSKC